MKGSEYTPKPIDAAFDDYTKSSGHCVGGSETVLPYRAEIIGYKTSYALDTSSVYCDPFVDLGYFDDVEKCSSVAKIRTGSTTY